MTLTNTALYLHFRPHYHHHQHHTNILYTTLTKNNKNPRPAITISPKHLSIIKRSQTNPQEFSVHQLISLPIILQKFNRPTPSLTHPCLTHAPTRLRTTILPQLRQNSSTMTPWISQMTCQSHHDDYTMTAILPSLHRQHLWPLPHKPP